MRILKIISVLLDYPGELLVASGAELTGEVQREDRLGPELRTALCGFIEHLCAQDLMDAQEHYVNTFDRGRSVSLLLFEHVHGESRDRGQAMVDLMQVYRDNGFDLSARELPDHIPLFLEYLSQRPPEEGLGWMKEVQHILGLIATRLQERDNPYHVLFDSLLQLIDADIDYQALREQVAKEERDDTPAAMDKVWEEEMVTFGARSTIAQGCNDAGSTGARGRSANKAPAMPSKPVAQESIVRMIDHL